MDKIHDGESKIIQFQVDLKNNEDLLDKITKNYENCISTLKMESEQKIKELENSRDVLRKDLNEIHLENNSLFQQIELLKISSDNKKEDMIPTFLNKVSLLFIGIEFSVFGKYCLA